MFKNTGKYVLRGLGNAIVNNVQILKLFVLRLISLKALCLLRTLATWTRERITLQSTLLNTYYNQPVVTDITQKLAQPMNPPLNNKTPLQAMSIEVGPNGVKFVPNGDYDPMAAFNNEGV